MRRRFLRALARNAGAVAWVSIAAWLIFMAAALAQGRALRPGWLVMLFVICVASLLLAAWTDSWRRMAIRESPLPVLVKRRLRLAHPTLEVRDADLVERGFRQFFMACARSRGRFVAMPSKAVDAYWHAFILDTRSYAEWCDRTLGRFLHHVPVERLGGDAKANDGLRRAWFFACRDEAIDPRQPSRLPLLFALDGKLAIAGGLRYRLPRDDTPRSKSLDDDDPGVFLSVSGFGDSAFAGDAATMGGCESSGGDGDGDGGDGCGGD